VDCGHVWAKVNYPPGHPQGPDPEDLIRPKPRKPSKRIPEKCLKCGSTHTHRTVFNRELLAELKEPFQSLLESIKDQSPEIRQALLYHLEYEILGNLDCGHVVTLKIKRKEHISDSHYCSFCKKETDAAQAFEVRDRWFGTANMVWICDKCAGSYSYEGNIDLLQTNENIKVGLL
jgi:hypothetical protein